MFPQYQERSLLSIYQINDHKFLIPHSFYCHNTSFFVGFFFFCHFCFCILPAFYFFYWWTLSMQNIKLHKHQSATQVQRYWSSGVSVGMWFPGVPQPLWFLPGSSVCCVWVLSAQHDTNSRPALVITGLRQLIWQFGWKYYVRWGFTQMLLSVKEDK